MRMPLYVMQVKGRLGCSLHQARFKELEPHKIKANDTVEEVKFLDSQGLEISDASAPAIFADTFQGVRHTKSTRYMPYRLIRKHLYVFYEGLVTLHD
jgi:hypothetical protein